MGNKQSFKAFECNKDKMDHNNGSKLESSICIGSLECTYNIRSEKMDTINCTPGTTCLQGYLGPLC